jgi:putative nucleotidyltransferase-like protein
VDTAVATTVDDAVRRIASFGLQGAALEPSIETVADEWPAVLGQVVHHRLTGLATAASGAGALSLSVEQQTELLTHHREAMVCAVSLERDLVDVGEALGAARIRHVVLKGPAVAHACYPDPSWRPFGDVDVLVPSDRFDAACLVLSYLGYERAFVDPRPGFAARFGKGAAHVGADGLEVDLHRLLADGPFGYWVDHDEILRSTISFELGGRSFLRLDDTALVLHACLHAVLGGPSPTLLQVRDIAQLSTCDDVRWDELAEWARRWRLRAVLERAFDLVERGFGEWALSEASRSFRRGMWPSPRERRALRACAEERFRGERDWASLRALQGVRAKAAYAGALVFPGREFIRSRTGSSGWSGYLRRWRLPLGSMTARSR